jgi:hypothetical protein
LNLRLRSAELEPKEIFTAQQKTLLISLNYSGNIRRSVTAPLEQLMMLGKKLFNSSSDFYLMASFSVPCTTPNQEQRKSDHSTSKFQSAPSKKFSSPPQKVVFTMSEKSSTPTKKLSTPPKKLSDRIKNCQLPPKKVV